LPSPALDVLSPGDVFRLGSIEDDSPSVQGNEYLPKGRPMVTKEHSAS
jgi:hypothetical protein